ncbi:DNA polymerase [Bacillus phage vB_BboS-125]|uniref:DNA polymerase I n=1 Tax=Bacillus phage vB_BboS-125 TaxID=2419618 RepID=A0A3G3BW81_9CAUD|nr:DNA polymerase [Bacillus phage vB_BboS-125]AYP68417.1 DNA polymerase I [Bacillus phage vB_BboS-125]
MKLGGMFGKQKTLAGSAKAKATIQPSPSTIEKMDPNTKSLAAQVAAKPKPGEIPIEWPKIPVQQAKDYQPILTAAGLEEYLKKCQETGLAGFDWETAAEEKTRQEFQLVKADYEAKVASLNAQLQPLDPKNDKDEIKQLEAMKKVAESDYEAKREAFLRTPLDPWKGKIVTFSVSAQPHESRVVPIDHKLGRNFEPDLPRDEARKLFMDIVERLLFKSEKIVKIAFNLSFETKYAAKYAKYIGMPVADPQQMIVRTLQLVAPQRIEDPGFPVKGWGLKAATKKVFGVAMASRFTELLQKHKAEFFDEVPADQGDGLIYSAEDSDYALQHYLYWDQVAKQIKTYEGCPNKNYSEWLHNVEMPFTRVIGLMEYWGMRWDQDLAQQKEEEALIMQEQLAERIKAIIHKATGEEVSPGKSGKTKSVKEALFERMNIPTAKWGKTGPSLDEEALINMEFMLENRLEKLDEEKYLNVPLPEGWEEIDPDATYGEPGFNATISKEERGAIRIAKRPQHPFKDEGIELINAMMKIQKYSTLISSHIKGRSKFLNSESKRIHAGYAPWTDTSRLSSFKPNGQNVPAPHNDDLGIRNFYVAGPGKILFLIDFAGFELRIMAWKSGDEVMIDIFNTGGDMHRKTAATMTGKPEEEVTKRERGDAKPGNFGISYGGTEHALQKTFLTDYRVRKTLDECLEIVNAVKRTYPGIPRYQREIELLAREQGYVETIYGYRRMLPEINSANGKARGSAGRQAANTPIQGTAADLMKAAQNRVYDAIAEGGVLEHGKTDMIAQIHDEIIFEVDDDPAVVEAMYHKVKAIMEQKPVEDFPVPVVAEGSVAYSWGNKKDVEEWLKERKGA